MSNISLKAIPSADIADRVTGPGLYYLNDIDTTELV